MKIETEKIKNIIKNSGNNFHCSVFKYLKHNNWSVIMSPYYYDNTSNKPREIDLIAEKQVQKRHVGGRYISSINIRLFIECKYINSESVFWFYEKDNAKLTELIHQTTPLKIDNSYTKSHHYIFKVNKVAKLFTTNQAKSHEYDIFYKGLNQSLNSMIYYRDYEPLTKCQNIENIVLTLNYPVIICNDFKKLYRVDIDNDDDPCIIANNFLLEVNYAYISSSGVGLNDYFLIDIVNFDKIDSYLESVETDASIMRPFLAEDE